MSTYKTSLDNFKEFGKVIAVFHPIAVIAGLPNVRPREMVSFDNDVKGQVMRLGRDTVEVLVYSKHPVRVGQSLTRTGKNFMIPLGDFLLGQVVDPLGMLLLPDQLKTSSLTTEIDVSFWERLLIEQSEGEFEIDVPVRPILDRKEIRRQLHTGITVVDTLLPLGHGQREVIAGDRKTGKTSFLLSAMKTQVESGSLVIYAAIGKRMIEVDLIRDFIVRQGMLSKMVMVVATSSDSPSLIYQAPFMAMTLAEFFCNKGRDVLVVLDDLTTHAKFYREINLLAHQFPGRDSYPGDVFFTHARLLERAGNYKNSQGGESAITCLPVAETQSGDLSDYIVSNLIGITDGHILFDTNEFVKGRRPAINVALSVTRVGKQTQSILRQELNRQITAFLSQYEQSESYARFGSELTKEVQKVIDQGVLMYGLFSQEVDEIVDKNVQILLIVMVLFDLIGYEHLSLITNIRRCVVTLYRGDSRIKNMIDTAVDVDSVDRLISNVKSIRNEILKLCQLT